MKKTKTMASEFRTFIRWQIALEALVLLLTIGSVALAAQACFHH